MINAERTSPIIYRYLGSHWYETLRDAEFLASSPNKFNDLFDCSALATGSVPDGEVEKYLTEHDWISVFSKISREKGFPIVDTTLNILNSGYINRDTLNIDERLKNSLKNRTPLSKAWRIVCFSESPTNSAERLRTEKRMWNRYSDKNRGPVVIREFRLNSRKTT